MIILAIIVIIIIIIIIYTTTWKSRGEQARKQGRDGKEEGMGRRGWEGRDGKAGMRRRKGGLSNAEVRTLT